MMMTQQASLQSSLVPASDSAIGQMDIGYHWIWTYGHLIPLATFSLATIASVLLNGPLWLTASAAGIALWSAAGFWVMRFVVNMNQLGGLPTRRFAQGETRVLDLGCGAGRTSVIVARECPRSNIVALDNFSAGYIAGRQDGDDPEKHSAHGKAKMEAVDQEIAARLAIGLLQHAMIEAFVFGAGEESERLERGVSALLLNGLRRRKG